MVIKVYTNYIKFIFTRWPSNFKTYLGKKCYQINHPDGRSFPSFKKRLKIAWVLRNEPTITYSLKEWNEKKI